MSHERIKLWVVAMWHNKAVSPSALNTVVGFLHGHRPLYSATLKIALEDTA